MRLGTQCSRAKRGVAIVCPVATASSTTESRRHRFVGPGNKLISYGAMKVIPPVMQERWRDMYHSYYPYLFDHGDKMSLYPKYPKNPREWQPSQLITTYDAIREDKYDAFIRLREKFPELYKDTRAWENPKPFGEFDQFYSRRFGLIGTKVFTTVEFDSHGNKMELTALWCPDNQVIGHRIKETHGYDAVEIGCMNVPVEFHKPYVTAVFKAKRVPVKHVTAMFRITPDAFAPVGTKLDVRHFRPGQEVDIAFQETDYGFRGVMFRHGFDGGPVWLGDSKWQRRPGSIGQEGTKRTHPGRPAPGQTGGRILEKSQRSIYRIDYKNSIIYLTGNYQMDVGTYVRLRDVDNIHAKTMWNHQRGLPPFPTFTPSKDEDLSALTTDECQIVSEPLHRYLRDEPLSTAKITQQDLDDAKRTGPPPVVEKKKVVDFRSYLANRRKAQKEAKEERKKEMKVKRVIIAEKQAETRRKKLASRRKVK